MNMSTYRYSCTYTITYIITPKFQGLLAKVSEESINNLMFALLCVCNVCICMDPFTLHCHSFAQHFCYCPCKANSLVVSKRFLMDSRCALWSAAVLNILLLYNTPPGIWQAHFCYICEFSSVCTVLLQEYGFQEVQTRYTTYRYTKVDFLG